jgi:hypothetical protein
MLCTFRQVRIIYNLNEEEEEIEMGGACSTNALETELV